MDKEKNTNVAQYESLELWLNECYGCDRKGKYDSIRRFVIDNRIPLANFSVKRAILDPKWLEEARMIENSLGIKMPFVRLKDKKGEIITMNFTEWKKAYQQATGRIEPKPAIKPKEEKEEPKKTRQRVKTTKKTNMKKKETKTVKID